MFFNTKVINKDKKNVLSLQLTDCLAKTEANDKKNTKGRTVLEHCLIVGAVARSLIQRAPHWLQFLFPPGSELIAAAHDVGKICPAFQEKIYRNLGYSPNSLPELKDARPDLENGWGYHAGVSQVAVKSCQPGKFIPEIVGQHHGYSPNTFGREANDECFGDHPWQRRREELIDELKAQLNCDWPEVTDSLHAHVLAGLTTISDWIGSGDTFVAATQDWRSHIELAVDEAGFLKPKLRNNLSFFEIFGFDLRDAQEKLIQFCSKPGIYIVEAPMGIGKTEAALYAAYKMLMADKATGIYFALPTQLTSDKIHERMNRFLEQILEIDCPNRKALLLHGNAWLQDTEMGEEGEPGGSWFQSSKRGLLAPFAVGTIDQALMAVMNVKHGFVRTFGLAGKVVILDEVHSYDAYTGTILNKLVEALVALHCTVIILSATLTKEKRRELLMLSNDIPLDNRYPLISTSTEIGIPLEIPIESSESTEVAIKLCPVDERAIEEALTRAERGQYILWIENTVDEAQAVYKRLGAKSKGLNISCGLLHSRFLKKDRALIEKEWISLFGKECQESNRLRGSILVGTQVLEQSIDIDADFLVSRMCPTDMLLQRLGRLWRHKETVRADSAVREAWVLAPAWDCTTKNHEQDFGKSALIYNPYVLYRSLEVWSQISSITLPGSIRALIEDTYSEREEGDSLSRYKEGLKKKKQTLQSFASIGMSTAGTTLAENKAGTRYSEQDTAEVLLLRSYVHHDKGTDITFLGGDPIHIPKNSKAQGKHENRKKALILQNNTVRVAEYLAPNESDLSWLKDYVYLGNKEDKNLVRIAKVQDSGEFDDCSENYELTYNSTLGYQAKKKR